MVVVVMVTKFKDVVCSLKFIELSTRRKDIRWLKVSTIGDFRHTTLTAVNLE